MCHWVVSFLLIANGVSKPITRRYTDQQMTAFLELWHDGRHCPGPRCQQVTNVKIKEYPDGCPATTN